MFFTPLNTYAQKQPFNSILEEKRIASLRQKLGEHDNAFLNSFLAHAVYTGRQWTLGLIKNHPDQLSGKHDAQSQLKSIIEESEINMTPKRAYEIYISAYLRNTFQLVDLPVKTGTYKSQQFGYSTEVNFKNGDYEALNNLARAGIFRSNNRDGTFTLHVAFRGTDTGARSFFDFVKDAYTDIPSYSDAFKPLEKALIEYVKDPNNKIANVHLSGHSLGGAPVQIMLDSLKKNKEFQEADINLKGYTYGSIGGFSYLWNKVVSCAYHAVAHRNFQQFKQLGVAALQAFNLQSTPSDTEIHRYKHRGDLIPIVGILGYNNKGSTFDLTDYCSQDAISESSVGGGKIYCEKQEGYDNLSLLGKAKNFLIDAPVNKVKKIFTLGFHDMLRYVRNVDSHINDLMIGNPELNPVEVTPRFEEFKLYTQRYNKVAATANNEISRKMFVTEYSLTHEMPPVQIDKKLGLNSVVERMRSMRIAVGLTKDLMADYQPSTPRI